MKVLPTAPSRDPRPEVRVPPRGCRWDRVLAVVAHPDDESFGLGAVLAARVGEGAEVGVLCLTHGEASTLHGVDGDLRAVREGELAEAAGVLGARRTWLLDHPDGALSDVGMSVVVADVLSAASAMSAEAFMVFDPSGVTGHPDHATATAAALRAADILDIPVVGWTLPAEVAQTLNAENGTSFTGHAAGDITYRVRVRREVQLRAAAAHASQALPAAGSSNPVGRPVSSSAPGWPTTPGCSSAGSSPAARTARPASRTRSPAWPRLGRPKVPSACSTMPSMPARTPPGTVPGPTSSCTGTTPPTRPTSRPRWHPPCSGPWSWYAALGRRTCRWTRRTDLWTGCRRRTRHASCGRSAK